MTPEQLNEMREHYYKYRTAKYMLEHPGTPYRTAYRYAKNAWWRKVRSWKKRGLINDDQSAGQDAAA